MDLNMNAIKAALQKAIDRTNPGAAASRMTPTQSDYIVPSWMGPGMIQRGNINLYDRPVVNLEDGSKATVRSTSFQDENGNEVLVPQVYNGKNHATLNNGIIQNRRTGEHLGIFKDPATADAYAQLLHEQQAKLLPLLEFKMRTTLRRPAPPEPAPETNFIPNYGGKAKLATGPQKLLS